MPEYRILLDYVQKIREYTHGQDSPQTSRIAQKVLIGNE